MNPAHCQKKLRLFWHLLLQEFGGWGEKVARDLDDSSGNARSIKRHVAGIVETMKDFEVETGAILGKGTWQGWRCM